MHALFGRAGSLALLCLYILMSAAAQAADSQPAESTDGPAGSQVNLQDVEAAVAELIAVQDQAARETARWDEQREHLEYTADLQARQLEQLGSMVATQTETIQQAEADHADVAAEVDALRTARQQLLQTIREQGQELLQTQALLPPPLRDELQPSADKTADTLQDETASPAQKLQSLANFSAQVDEVLSRMNVVREVLELDGRRIETRVLYIGGAIGYYVSPDGERAGLRLRRAGEWQTVPRNDAAEQIADAIAVAEKETAAHLVRLPVVMEEDE